MNTKKQNENMYDVCTRKLENSIIAVAVILAALFIFYIFFINHEVKENKQKMLKAQIENTKTPEPEPTPSPKVCTVKTKYKKVKLLKEHTVYHYSSYNRDNNLRVATKMLSKTVVLPGEDFSFFGVIGNPSAEKGFKEAGVIVNHQSATALAGGICEVATSLNTVVVNAGIKTNAQNHSVNVGYLNSTDHEATVTYDGGIDLKFTNTLKYPIMIMQSVSGGNVTSKLFKVKVFKNIIFENKVTQERGKEKFVAQKQLAKNIISQTKYDLKFSKVEYYYLNPNDFFERKKPKARKMEKFLKSLRKAANTAKLEIDRSKNDKKLAVKNTKQFPVLISISYNSKGDVKTEIYKLKKAN